MHRSVSAYLGCRDCAFIETSSCSHHDHRSRVQNFDAGIGSDTQLKLFCPDSGNMLSVIKIRSSMSMIGRESRTFPNCSAATSVLTTFVKTERNTKLEWKDLKSCWNVVQVSSKMKFAVTGLELGAWEFEGKFEKSLTQSKLLFKLKSKLLAC